MEKYIRIKRIKYLPEETIGIGEVVSVGSGQIEYMFFTLEPQWKNNEKYTAIPEGSYKAKKYKSPTKGWVILLQKIKNRTMIEIHAGNYRRDTKGCILVGEGLKDINKDKKIDVMNSRRALNKILKFFPEQEEFLVKME